MNTSNVLIIDDSLYIHKMVRAYLENDPIVLYSAYDGEAGLLEAAEHQPSLVLIDIDMPELDGLEVCRKLKANPRTRDTPVIFLTADCSTRDKVTAFEMGAIDYITKPFKPEELRARVRAAIRTQNRVDDMTMTDPVTGFWNEAYLNLQIPVQLSLAQRTGQPVSCVMAQIDNMEAANETYGYDGSERAINTVVTAWLALSRTEDILCHLGGGRFVVLQPAMKQADSILLANKMRKEIELQQPNSDSAGSGVTCSFGVADSDTQPLKNLLESVEECIDRAKAAGGDIVMAANPFADSIRQAA